MDNLDTQQDTSEVITEYVKLGKHDMKNGIVFLSQDIGVKLIELWCDESSCPLSKVRIQVKLLLSMSR